MRTSTPPRPTWYMSDKGWKRSTSTKRASRRCGALLEDGQRCAGPYHCPEHG